MIKVTLQDILNFNLPLYDNTEVLPRRNYTSKEILKNLEKKYHIRTNDVCTRYNEYCKFKIFQNPYISEDDKYRWITNYEVIVRSSLTYKFWIFYYTVIKRK